MTDRYVALSRGASNLSDTAKWVNVSGASVPAYGVIQFRTNFAAGYNQAKKPNGSSGIYYANGPVIIADGGHGESLIWNHSRLVLIEGSPIVGTVVGPVDDSWSMSESGIGFLVMHQPVGGVGAVVQVGGGSISVLHGIVYSQLGCGYYEVDLSEWDGETPGTTSGSGSVDNDCGFCDQFGTASGSSSGSTNCGQEGVIPEFNPQTVAVGTRVLVYDPASTIVPLEVGTDCLLVNMGDENAVSSTSSSSGEMEPVYQILRGHQEHVIIYDEDWDCCEGVLTKIKRVPIVFAGLKCADQCGGECP